MIRTKPLIVKILVSLGLIALTTVATLQLSQLLFPGGQATIDALLKAGAKITPQLQAQLLGMKLAQGVQTVGIFLMPAIIMLWVLYGRLGVTLPLTNRFNVMDAINVFFLIVFSNSLLFVVAQYSQLIPWPKEWLADNARAQRLTELLLGGRSSVDLALNLFVVAVLPAVAEEFFFRGFLQRVAMKWIRDPHFVIFLVAVLFSAVHFDPVMFLPRFLLGALLGYLYYWSCSLWLPILAHFLNNGQYVLAGYLMDKMKYAKAAEDGVQAFAIDNFYLILSTVLIGLILYTIYFRHMNVKPTRNFEL